MNLEYPYVDALGFAVAAALGVYFGYFGAVVYGFPPIGRAVAAGIAVFLFAVAVHDLVDDARGETDAE